MLVHRERRQPRLRVKLRGKLDVVAVLVGGGREDLVAASATVLR
ncbi:hypothetical protein [Actinopolyspora lacussalsi]|nr:hypothetical protein [Actinopolyspora righensis]